MHTYKYLIGRDTAAFHLPKGGLRISRPLGIYSILEYNIIYM